MIRIELDVMLARRKMTLTELSRRLDIALPNLSILKNGHAKAIRMALLDALCRELDCQPGELLVWEPDDAAEKEQSSIEKRGWSHPLMRKRPALFLSFGDAAIQCRKKGVNKYTSARVAEKTSGQDCLGV